MIDIARSFPEARDYQRSASQAAFTVLSGDAETNIPHNKAFGLFHDAGLGKGLTTLMIAEWLGSERVAVVAPAIARVSWPILIEKHARHWLPYTRLPRFAERPARWILDDRVFVLLTYDMFSQQEAARRWLPLLMTRRWDLVVIDECHYLKDATAARTQNIYGRMGARVGPEGFVSMADRVLLLSGTPTPNHAGELFPHYAAFWSHLVSRPDGKPLGESDFEERFTFYQDGPWGRQVKGSRNQEILREALTPVISRCRRHEVMRDLPPLTVQDVALLAPARPTPIPDRLWRLHERLLDLDEPEDLIGLPVEDKPLSELRRLLGNAKAAAAAEWIRERLGLGVEKMLVFAWHREVMHRLEQALFDFHPVTVHGGTPEEDRVRAVNAFQEKPLTRLFIGQTRAAGTAITLTRASEVAIVEPSWTPSDNEQAIARAWRMGQSSPVLVSFLYLPGSLDQRVMTVFRRKAQELVRLWGAATTIPS